MWDRPTHTKKKKPHPETYVIPKISIQEVQTGLSGMSSKKFKRMTDVAPDFLDPYHSHFPVYHIITELWAFLPIVFMVTLVKRYGSNSYVQTGHLTWVGSIMADDDSLEFTQWHCFQSELVCLKNCTILYPNCFTVSLSKEPWTRQNTFVNNVVKVFWLLT